MFTNEDLTRLQDMSIDDKIVMSKLRIVEAYEHFDGNMVIAFSGGIDSTVLVHLVRSVYPDIKAVYCDTGLEYPEVKEHVKSFNNIEIIRPSMGFKEVLENHGWLYPNKEVAEKIYYARGGATWAVNAFNGMDKDGNPSEYKRRYYVKWKYLIDSPFKFSKKCCDIMKKKPFKEYIKKHNGCGIYIGTRAEESQLRKNVWLKNGCNVFKSNHSMPLSFWTDQDTLKYVLDNKLKIPSVYGYIIKGFAGRYRTTGVDRTGCIFCPAGVHMEDEPNRFQRLRETHPKLWEYCINKLELGKLLDYINVKY